MTTLARPGLGGGPSGELLQFEAGDGNERLDQFLADRLPGHSRTRIRRAIAEGDALVNGAPSAKGTRLLPGDCVTVRLAQDERSSMTPEPIELDILFESPELIVVNKPAGLLVHPSHTEKSGTLANALAHHFVRAGGPPIRAGLLHRLDRGTSGVIVVAKTVRAHRVVAREFHQRRVRKKYLAIVRGRIADDAGEIVAPVGRDASRWPRWCVMEGGRPAQTRYTVRERFVQHTLLELEPLTGRTYQLRIHCAAIGHPIVGDRVYGTPDGSEAHQATPSTEAQMLHAYSLTLRDPESGQIVEFVAPLPAAMLAMLEALAAGES